VYTKRGEMIVYHVTSHKKLQKYDDTNKLEGHFDQARVLHKEYKLDSL